MTKNKEQGSHRQTAGLLAVVVIAVMPAMMVGYHQHEAEGHMATVEEELATATHAPGELERHGSSIAREETASAEKTVTAQAQDAEAIARQATPIAEQATAAAESDAGRVEQQARVVLARHLAAESELAIREGGGESLSRAALLAIESVRQYPTVEGDSALRSALSMMPPLEFQLIKDGYTWLNQIAFDPGGRWIAAAYAYNQSATVWDLSTGEEIARLEHDGEVNGVASDPAGSLLATTASDGTARLWETGTWKQVARLEHDADGVGGGTFGPEGKRLATRSGATAYIWDVSTGKEIARLEHGNFVRYVAFSPYGKWIATAETDGSIVWIWDAETGEEVARLKHDSIVAAMAFSPYGKWLATASGNTAQVWEVNTGRQVVRVMHRDVVNDVAFSPDSMLLATGSKDNTARIWEVATGRERMQFMHKNEVVSIDFSPAGTSLATGGGYTLSESPARVWDVATGQEIARMEHPKQVEYVAFSPDGRRLATKHWNGNVIYVWDVSPGGAEVLHFGRANSVKAVAFSPDGRILASGNSDGSLQVWNAATWEEITPAPMKHEGEIEAVALSPDGSRLASAAGDGTASVWDLATGEELIRVRHVAKYGSWTTDVTFSPDGQLLATSSGDGTARLWDVATGLEVARATHRDAVWDVDFSPDGKRLASASSGEVRVLEAPDWEEVAVLRHAGANDIAFSPDGALLASAGSDDMARVWDTSTWQEVVHMKHNDRDEVVSAVAFSPDSRKLATGSGNTMARVWDTETWQEIARVSSGADQVLFSRDGRWLFTRSDYRNTVRMWDTSTGGREVARIEHARHTWDMALSPDGRLLATASGWLNEGGELKVTAWQPDDLADEACSRLGRNLTWSEWQQYMGDEPYSETCPGLPIPLSSLRDTVDQIEERLCMDDPDVASARYAVAVSLALQANRQLLGSVDSVCRHGTQEGFAEAVLPACERAVELAPKETSTLDSRGIARALTGDYEGALADLKAVVEAWESNRWYSESVAQRKQIIEAMEEGKDVTPYIERCRELAAKMPTPGSKTPAPTATPTPDATPTPRPAAASRPTTVVRSFVADVDRVVVGRPGETVSHTLTVTNTGNITGSYDIWAKTVTYHEFSLPGLNYGSDTFDYRGSVGVIGPDDSVQMPINVRIPGYATGDQFEQTSLLVQSDYTTGVSMQLVTAVSYTTSIERIGHAGLDARDVFVRGDYAYVAAGMEGLRILDVSDTLHPVEVGSYKTARGALGQVESVQVIGNHAYLVTNLSGIRIVDVSDPAAPVEVGAYRPGGSVQALKLAGNYAYVVWNSCIHYRCTDRLRIVDISDPTAPVEVSVYGRSFEGGGYDTGDRINDVAVMGDHAYLFMPDEMQVLDVSDPVDPVEVDAYEKTGYEAAIWGDYAYVHDDKQVSVVDISNPELVVEVSTYNVPDSIVDVSQAGGYLYVATEKDDVYILDLAIPSSPLQAGIYRAPGNREVVGAAAKGGYVYLAASSAGLQIVEVADPAAPEKAGVYGAATSVMGLALAEGYAYVADRYNGLRVLDLAAGPSAPVEVGFYDDPGAGALDVAVGGDYAYVILGHGDLHVLDVSDPATPVQVGVYEGGWHKVEVSGGYAFVVGGTAVSDDKPFHVLDISDPTAPKQVATYEAADFALADGYLYLLSDEEERMTVLDAATLEEVSVYDMPEHHQDLYFSREISVAGDYAYVLENYAYATGSGAGWQVVDISDPTAPVGVNVGFNYRPEYESWGEPAAAAYGGYTFLAAKSSGLRVLDVTDVDTPTEVDSFGAPKSIMDVAVDDEGYVYVASDLGGLYILRYAGDGGEQSMSGQRPGTR
jgi:WD40 repeat protein